MEFLVAQPSNSEGVHVGAIARAIQGGDAAQIRSGLCILLDIPTLIIIYCAAPHSML